MFDFEYELEPSYIELVLIEMADESKESEE